MMARFQWKVRYSVLTVLFVTWVLCFMDRMAMSVAIPYIGADFNLSPVAMGAVMSAFFFGYSIAQIPGGLLADRYGIRKVATFAIAGWSIFTFATGMVTSLFQLIVVRAVFGLIEGVYPGCAFKGVCIWFPQRERATAMGIKLSSSSLGSALAPLFMVSMMSTLGWRNAFRSFFVAGIAITFLLWFYLRDRPSESPRVSAQELGEIEDDGSQSSASAKKETTVKEIMKEMTVWQCFFILLFFDMTLWGFQTWLPSYLVKARGLRMMQMGFVASLPFLVGMFAAMLGGWVSDRFFSRRRRVPIVATQLLTALFLYLTFTTKGFVPMVIWQTLAAACIKFFLSAFWALPVNTVPKSVMGTAGSFINMAGQIAAFVAPLAIGFLVKASNGDFSSTFWFLIGAALISCCLVFTLRGNRSTAASQELLMTAK